MFVVFIFHRPHVKAEQPRKPLQRERKKYGCPSCFLKPHPFTEKCPKSTALSKYLSPRGPEHPSAHQHSLPVAPSAPGTFCHRVTVGWVTAPGTVRDPLVRTLSRAASGPPGMAVLFGASQELNLCAVLPWWEWEKPNNIEIKKKKSRAREGEGKKKEKQAWNKTLEREKQIWFNNWDAIYSLWN